MNLFHRSGSDSIGIQFYVFVCSFMLCNKLIISKMLEDDEIDSFISDGVHELKMVTFRFKCIRLNGNLKFPCLLWACIKTLDKKIAECNNKVSIVNNVAEFNQDLVFEKKMIYNKETKQFTKKNVLVVVLLESKRKPGDEKLVGRIQIDLSSIANNRAYSQPAEYDLAYCSIGGSLTFSFDLISIQQIMENKNGEGQLQKQEKEEEFAIKEEKVQEVIKNNKKQNNSPKKPYDIEIIEEHPHSESDSKQSPRFLPCQIAQDEIKQEKSNEDNQVKNNGESQTERREQNQETGQKKQDQVEVIVQNIQGQEQIEKGKEINNNEKYEKKPNQQEKLSEQKEIFDPNKDFNNSPTQKNKQTPQNEQVSIKNHQNLKDFPLKTQITQKNCPIQADSAPIVSPQITSHPQTTCAAQIPSPAHTTSAPQNKSQNSNPQLMRYIRIAVFILILLALLYGFMSSKKKGKK